MQNLNPEMTSGIKGDETAYCNLRNETKRNENLYLRKENL